MGSAKCQLEAEGENGDIMATRFYFTRQAHTAINPGTIFTWGSSVKSIYRLVLDTHATTDASYLNSVYTGYGQGTVLFRQFISDELSGGIVFDSATTYELVQRFCESSGSANAFNLFGVAIVSEDGTTIRDKFDALEKDGTEFAIGSTETAIANLRNGTSGLNYTTVAGDHLVVEMGWDQDGSGSYSIHCSNGFLDTTDLSGAGDTLARDGWIEFSNTITLGGGDPAPPATNEDYDVTAYISGVLDEMV